MCIKLSSYIQIIIIYACVAIFRKDVRVQVVSYTVL